MNEAIIKRATDLATFVVESYKKRGRFAIQCEDAQEYQASLFLLHRVPEAVDILEAHGIYTGGIEKKLQILCLTEDDVHQLGGAILSDKQVDEFSRAMNAESDPDVKRAIAEQHIAKARGSISH